MTNYEKVKKYVAKKMLPYEVEVTMEKFAPYIENPEKISDLSDADGLCLFLQCLLPALPEYIVYFKAWELLKEYDWVTILASHPQYKSKFESFKSWNAIPPPLWTDLLSAQPQFLKLCPNPSRKDRYDYDCLSEHDWVEILKAQPSLISQCPYITNPAKCYSDFNFSDWADVLSQQPQLADQCPWEQSGDAEFADAWLRLVTAQPQFVDKVDWDVAGKSTNGSAWAELLLKSPEYAKHCPWDKFNSIDWIPIFKYVPQFAKFLKIHDRLSVRAWGYLIAHRPEWAEHFTKWNRFTAGIWASVLSRQPQFADRCDRWDKMDEQCWCKLLCKQPQFVDKCNIWGDFSYDSKAKILEHQPQLSMFSHVDNEITDIDALIDALWDISFILEMPFDNGSDWEDETMMLTFDDPDNDDLDMDHTLTKLDNAIRRLDKTIKAME